MGLDMYAYRIKQGILTDDDQVDFGPKLFTDGHANEGVDTDFDYWRKFNNMHGWMEALYRKKGGLDESFNCNTVRLMPQDLDVLESLALSKALPPTAGFFFGATELMNDDDKQAILEFVQKARAIIAEGGAVAYDSWW